MAALAAAPYASRARSGPLLYAERVMLTTDALRALIADHESDRVEPTVSTTNTDKFGEAICAFANDFPNHRQPGYLVVGVDDDGTVRGRTVTDTLLRNLGALRSNVNIKPLPAMTVQKHVLPEGEVAVVAGDHPEGGVRTIAFFNNKGGVGKTTLVQHLAWMYAELGLSVVAADLDPQANLSAVLLDEDRLEALVGVARLPQPRRVRVSHRAGVPPHRSPRRPRAERRPRAD